MKFINDLKSIFYKRLKQSYRDNKSFILEIICPILLTLIGCLVFKVEFKNTIEPISPKVENFSNNQTIYYGSYNNDFNFTTKNYLVNNDKLKSKILNYSYAENSTSILDRSIEYMNNLYLINDSNCYGSFYIYDFDDRKQSYNFIEFINAKGRQAPMFYTSHFLGQIINNSLGNNSKGVEINFVHRPFSLLNKVKVYNKQFYNYFLVFFVNIAFSLMPANFIRIIVDERINNTKHLMRVSGINIHAYWVGNFIFELVKYYLIGVICLIITYLFDYLPDYLYITFILYGPTMISFTYFISYFFTNESSAQNGAILFNLIIGSLSTTVICVFRAHFITMDMGKILSYIFRIFPTFCFGYSYNQLLNGEMILLLDCGDWRKLVKYPKSVYRSLKYSGCDDLYLGILFIVYTLAFIYCEKKNLFIENNCGKCSSNKKNKKNTLEKDNKVEDKVIFDCQINTLLPEDISNIKDDSQISVENTNILNTENLNDNIIQSTQNESRNINYPLKVENLSKTYCKFNNQKCPCPHLISSNPIPIKYAVSNISFKVQKGECFGLLGLNGSGKTTTFKCLTQQILQTKGDIYIDNLNTRIGNNFNSICSFNQIGYCPQFDAVFDYLTVKENLEVYSSIKCVNMKIKNKLIDSLISLLALNNFTNKISKNLSGGNKRKLSVAISMLSNPLLLLLDEPSKGMDPGSKRFMWNIINKISFVNKKCSIIMTSHSMDETENLCNKIGILINGKFICMGTIQEIKEKYNFGYIVSFKIKKMDKSDIKNEKNLYINEDNIQKFKINFDNISQILTEINKKKYLNLINQDSFGFSLYNKIKKFGAIDLDYLIQWCNYMFYASKILKEMSKLFENIYLIENEDNSFVFKVKKDEKNKWSIGYLVSLFEKIKEDNHVVEYSMKENCLEQIFNRLAEEFGEEEVEEGDKDKRKGKSLEIKVNEEILYLNDE